MNRQRQWLAVAAIALAMLAAGTARAEPKLWYVVTNEVATSNGETWETAFTNVQEALDDVDVTPGVTNIIHLAGHTFDLSAALNWASQTNVIMRGGYEADPATVGPGTNNPALWPTVLRQTASGQRVMWMEDLDDCLLEHVTITGGSVVNSISDHIIYNGGGIHAVNSTVTLESCEISGNTIWLTSGSGDRHGGGMYVRGGGAVILRNCRIEHNTTRGTSQNGTRGGGVYLAGGGASLLIEHSTIVSNISHNDSGSRVSYSAGVEHASGSALTIRNCLIAFNENKYTTRIANARYGAGVVLRTGGVIESSTIVSNRTHNWADAGAGLRVYGGSVTNTIVWGNTRAEGEPSNIGFSGATETANVFYSLAPELTLTNAPNHNLNTDPLFLDAAGGNFRLDRGSPCVNTGIAVAWMTGAVDLDGNPRKQDGRPDRSLAPDMGAFELAPLPTTGDLVCDFVADVYFGIDELDVVFTAFVGGAETNGLVYRWHFTNGVDYVEGGPVITNTYFPGVHTVKLEVDNDQPETAAKVKTGYIHVGASTLYVSLGGNNQNGFDWDNAYTNLQTALDQPGVSEIRVAGGDYTLTSQINWIGHSDVTIRGGYDATTETHDPENQSTILRQTASGRRVMWMTGLDDCLLEHVTITGGSVVNALSDHVAYNGGGIRAFNSTVTLESCEISGNTIWLTSGSGDRHGGGMYVSGGGAVILRNCRIEHNTVRGPSQNGTRGGGVYLAGGGASLLIEHSTIVSNISQNDSNSRDSYSAGVEHASGSALTIRNCLIAFNENKNLGAPVRSRYGAGVVLESGGLIESSTIASNRTSSTYAGAGLWVNNGGTVTNTIVWSNTRAEGEPSNIGFGGTATEALRVFYSLASELTLTETPNWNRADDPLFVNATLGNFHLQNGSPAINKGTNQPWMIGAVDLDGLPRIQQGTVDMGCFETQPPKGTLIMFR